MRQYQEEREREKQAVAEQERQRRLVRERELQLQAKREIEQFRERVSSWNIPDLSIANFHVMSLFESIGMFSLQTI